MKTTEAQKIDFIPNDNSQTAYMCLAMALLELPYAHDRRRRDLISRIANGHCDRFLSLELEKNDSRVTVSVETSRKTVEDPEGTVWEKGELQLCFNWPTHGTRSSEWCLGVLDFYREVILLANEAVKPLGELVVWTKVSTHAERVAQEVEFEIANTQRLVTAAVQNSPERKNMRVGSREYPSFHPPLNVREGIYDVVTDSGKKWEKHWRLIVRDGGAHGVLSRKA